MVKWACHEKDHVVVRLYWDLDFYQLYINRLQQVHIGALYSLSMELTRLVYSFSLWFQHNNARLFWKIKSVY